MKTRQSSSSDRLSKQALELSVAASQVIAQRMSRMAAAGANPSARDQKEFAQMSNEKVLAFYQSWTAIWIQMFKSQITLAQTFSSAFTSSVIAGRQPSGSAAMSAFSQEANKILSAGIGPVHRKAVSNAKRLSRSS